MVAKGQVSDAPPVAVLHGAMRSRLGLWPTAWYLRRHGFPARAFGYETRRETLAEHGARLCDFVRGWVGDRRPEVFGFLTHSMGGLVVRSFLARPEAAQLADRFRVVMLSPPNQGAKLAALNVKNPVFRWLYGQAAHELTGPSPQGLGPLPDNVEVLILAGGTGGATGYNPRLPGDNDGVVATDEMGLPGVDPVMVGGMHSFLQWRPTVLQQAIGFLRGSAVDPESKHTDPEP